MGAILSAIENNPKQIKRLLGIDQDQLRQLITLFGVDSLSKAGRARA